MNIKPILKVIAVNLVVIFLLLIAPAVILRFYKQYISTTKHKDDPRVAFPAYPNKEYARKVLNPFNHIPSRYEPFIGSRREIFASESINIFGVYRTRKSISENLDNSNWFFGGSTMWGVGVDDKSTIPSLFALEADEHVFNFGEPGWTSRASLNQLLNVLGDGHSPKRVIFYDGVNDVRFQCIKKNDYVPSTGSDSGLRALSGSNKFLQKLTESILEPYHVLLKYFGISSNLLKTQDDFDCAENNQKSKKIASHLINNWMSVYALSQIYGFEFLAVLQPQLYSSKTNSDYLNDFIKNSGWEFLEAEYAAVYFEIKEKLREVCASEKLFCESIVLGDKWLNSEESLFIDYNHLNQKGNKIIAEKIINKLLSSK